LIFFLDVCRDGEGGEEQNFSPELGAQQAQRLLAPVIVEDGNKFENISILALRCF
jgi:hypothetical protein